MRLLSKKLYTALKDWLENDEEQFSYSEEGLWVQFDRAEMRAYYFERCEDYPSSWYSLNPDSYRMELHIMIVGAEYHIKSGLLEVYTKPE